MYLNQGGSSQQKKNGLRRGKQSYKLKNCPKGCRFAYGYKYVENPSQKRYASEVKQLCIKMYFKFMGIRGIARVTDINHTTIISWIK